MRYLLLLLIFSVFLSCWGEKRNAFYPTNPEPLLKTAFVQLPLGAVKPEGWLKDQLRAQADGLTGHLDEFWPDIQQSAWKGDVGESWERGPYYLDGLLPLAYLLEDDRLIAKTKPFVEFMVHSRQENGWFGPAKNGDRWPVAVALKVLSQYYEVTGDERALDTIKGWFRYLHENPPDWPDKTWRGVRAMEHAVTGYWLYRRTGDPAVLETIQSIAENSFNWSDYYHRFPWDSTAFSDGRMPLNWAAVGLTAHVVNNAMAIKYPGIYYQQAGLDSLKRAVFDGLKKYDLHHGQVGGRFSGDEHLSGNSPSRGTELCSVVELMFSLENLVEIFGEPGLADRLELLAYNSLPGTMTPDCWAHQYDQQANQVLVTFAKRDWATNGDASNIYGLMPNYPCCLANFHQGWPKFVSHMWMATPDNGLAAVAYGPNKVKAQVGKNTTVSIAQRTIYPFSGEITFDVTVSKPDRFPIHFRIPGWAESAELFVNGKKVKSASGGGFVRVNRTWNSGDEIRLDLAMEVRSERRFNNAVALRRGPLYFALRIGKDYKKIQLKERNFGSIDYMGTTDWEIRPTTPWNYGLVLDPENTVKNMSLKENELTRFPFADRGEMVYDEVQNRYIPWENEAPLVLTAKGKIIPEWGLVNNSAANPPKSPKSDAPEQEIELVPYGCTRLRVSEFPLIGLQ